MAGRKPDLEAFVVTEGKRDGDKGYWNEDWRSLENPRSRVLPSISSPIRRSPARGVAPAAAA